MEAINHNLLFDSTDYLIKFDEVQKAFIWNIKEFYIVTKIISLFSNWMHPSWIKVLLKKTKTIHLPKLLNNSVQLVLNILKYKQFAQWISTTIHKRQRHWSERSINSFIIFLHNEWHEQDQLYFKCSILLTGDGCTKWALQ